jgi:hypothetical protein
MPWLHVTSHREYPAMAKSKGKGGKRSPKGKGRPATSPQPKSMPNKGPKRKPGTDLRRG